VTSKALVATVPSYLLPTGPTIVAPHRSWRVVEASCQAAVVVRALAAYSL
jgi:hypothetical protein